MRNLLTTFAPVFLSGLMMSPVAAHAAPDPSDYFKITFIDEETGRGVPLVELRTTNDVSYHTDSNGIAAFYEPGLMDSNVFFQIKSHGYEFLEKFFDERGKVLKTTRGGSAVLKIKRLNIAERLYRITGAGIYRDSVLLGAAVPIKHPLLNARVIGQDTVMATPYRGKLYWFWGDTLGPADFNGGTSGATSEWPDRGGLDPSVGVDLTYFVNESGFSKEMCPSSAIPGPGLKWIEGVMTVKDENGMERLVAKYDRVKNLEESYERGLIIFNDQTESFDRLVQFDLKAPLYPAGRPFPISIDGQEYYYFPSPYPMPLVRVKADMKHITDARAYEGFTCLVAGSKYNKQTPKLDRGANGRLIYGWKANTEPLSYEQQRELIEAGKIKPEDGVLHLEDFDTGNAIEASSGSVYWNAFRRRWVMIAQQNVGQVWYAEGDNPLGPWVYAKKIVSHDQYTFYWPGQHPFFDQDGGRLIYFEGTYTDTFSGNPVKTPRYNYNQIMYRLKLDDPRLFLPVAVYRMKKDAGGTVRYLTREGVDSDDAWDRIAGIPFFALSPERAPERLVPVFATMTKSGVLLQREPPKEKANEAQPLFYALPAQLATPELSLAATWHCNAKSSDGSEYPFILELELEGEKVIGPPKQEGLVITGGAFRNRKLQVNVKLDADNYLLTGTLKQGKLSGEYEQVNGEEKGTWEGERTDFLWKQEHSPAIVPLYEYRRGKEGSRIYSTNPNLKDPTLERSAEPICRVWRNPMSVLILDRKVKAVPIIHIAERGSAHP